MSTTDSNNEGDRSSSDVLTENNEDSKSNDVESPIAEVNDDKSRSNKHNSTRSGCCQWFMFDDVAQAKGYCRLGMARGPLVMSNIFLSTSLIYLASIAAGCVQESQQQEEENAETIGTYDLEINDECNNRIYGFRPASLITNIAVIAGLLSAFTMPIVGAMIDYTSYRRTMGIATAIFITIIQMVQVGTVSATWYPMALLQALAAWLFQVQVLATYAYLPDVARIVGEKTMSGFTGKFVMVQFTSQLLFLIVVTAISVALGLNDVRTGQISQATNVVTSIAFFVLGWTIMPNVPPNQQLKPNERLITQGFIQIWTTMKNIHNHYSRSLRWFFLATIFAEASANAFTVVSVVYMKEQLKMSGSQIGLVFVITLISTVPGSTLATFVTRKTNPKTSWKCGMTVFIAFTIAGAFVLTGPERQTITYLWGFFWGICLGWFYPTENVFFSLLLPKGQEAELTGFFIYCNQVLVWLPPLVFTILIEAGVHQKYGIMSVCIYFALAVLILMLMPSWDEVLKEVGNHPSSNDDNHTTTINNKDAENATTNKQKLNVTGSQNNMKDTKLNQDAPGDGVSSCRSGKTDPNGHDAAYNHQLLVLTATTPTAETTKLTTTITNEYQ